MDSLAKEWSLFLDRCLEKRIDADVFQAAAVQLYSKSPLPGQKLAGLVLRPRSASSSSLDPRVIVYIERLLAIKRIDTSDILISAFRSSKDRQPDDGTIPSKENSSKWHNPPELEEIIFHRLHKAFVSGERPATNKEGCNVVAIVSKWMQSMVTSHTSDEAMMAIAGVQQQPQQQSINIREGLGMLVVSLVENQRILDLLNREQLKDLRKIFSQALSSFIPFLTPTSLQIGSRLEISQKEHDFHDKSLQVNGDAGDSSGLEVAALQLEAVMDLPMIPTRAGLYVFLNSLLVARPLTDDLTILNYLLSRYKIDTQNIATALVTAAFDILANAMYRNESSQVIFCLKSFLINKIPILLTQLSASIFPLTPELYISQALSHVDSNAFPPFSQGFDEMMGNNTSLSDVRQDFLNSCALHGLIPANAVERLLGEAPMQGPPERKYTKQDLLNQCKDNPERVNALVDELENLDGNAGAIVGAVTEFASHLCDTQTTMYLKTMCNSLSRKPQALDVILQFTSPASILRPLCQFLDEWRYDGDQGEYQPVYDEFGAILVLVLAFVYRFDLTYHELGVNHDSFVAQLLEHGHTSVPPDELTDEQGRHLGNWLRGLYDDKEGLSNEVFASCRPQQFYLIVPTLFNQTVTACSAEVLSLDSVKGGLEYLHETFLLPSLVGGLRWMASHALEQNHQDLDVLMQIFQKLLQSAPTSGDAQAMNSTIMSIVSGRLKDTFRTLQKRHPTRPDIEPLLQAVKAHLHYERSVYPSTIEVEQWTNAPNHDLAGSLRHTVQQLSTWASAASMQLSPPAYTHRQIYACLKLMGPDKTVRAIVEEIKAQSEHGNGASALDVGVSIVCAPTTENSPVPVEWAASPVTAATPPRTHTNLREMLKQQFENAASLVSSDPLAAETIVRLHRRVETQLAGIGSASIQAAQMNMPDVSMVDVETQHLPDIDISKAINDAAAATIAAGDLGLDKQDLQGSLEQHLDLNAAAAAGGIDLAAMGVTANGAGDMNTAMGDLPDLDLGDMGDMGGMGMGDDDNDWGLDFDNM